MTCNSFCNNIQKVRYMRFSSVLCSIPTCENQNSVVIRDILHEIHYIWFCGITVWSLYPKPTFKLTYVSYAACKETPFFFTPSFRNRWKRLRLMLLFFFFFFEKDSYLISKYYNDCACGILLHLFMCHLPI